MKISKSKQELARIISENGGWRDGEFAAQDGDGTGSIDFFESKPQYHPNSKFWRGVYDPFERIDRADVTIKNFHQTILSRDEYFRLYPAQDADGWIEWKGGDCPVRFGKLIDVRYRDGHVQLGCRAESRCDTELYATTHWGNSGGAADIIAYRLHKPEQAKPEFCESVTRAIPEPDGQVWTSPPSIEQLATDYRNAKDYAERKQQEADAAKDDADARLKALELAGEALGLLVSPITANQESELAIEVKVGDEVECVESNIERDKYNGMVGRLHSIDESDTSTPYLVDFCGEARIWCHEVKFIRRP